METVRIRDPGWKKVGFGIRDKHPGSATLVPRLVPVPTEIQLVYQNSGFTQKEKVLDPE